MMFAGGRVDLEEELMQEAEVPPADSSWAPSSRPAPALSTTAA